jgi:hypothetical protein
MSEENTSPASAPIAAAAPVPAQASAEAEQVANAAPAIDPTDIPPDRLAIDSRSPFFDAEKLGRGVGIKFKDRVRRDVDEYCISESWVRVQAGKAMDRKGRPLTLKLPGPVEAWYEDLGEGAPVNKLD